MTCKYKEVIQVNERFGLGNIGFALILSHCIEHL